MGRFGLILTLLRPFLRGTRVGARGIAEVAPGIGGGGRSRLGALILVAVTVAALAPYLDYGKVQADLDKAGAFIDAHDEAVIGAGEDVLNAIVDGGTQLIEWIGSHGDEVDEAREWTADSLVWVADTIRVQMMGTDMADAEKAMETSAADPMI
jgi:hypothetical protein